MLGDKQTALEGEIAELKRQLESCRAELKEAREQQTATAEVLQVINSSPGALTPVFDAMLEKATRLCEAAFGVLWTYDGDCFHAAALRNVPASYAEFLTQAPYKPEPEGAHGRIVSGESLIHIVDVADTELYRSGGPLRRALVDLGGARSGIAAALRKNDTLVGIFIIYRQEVRAFSDKQIALLQNFADQAVIAIENTRLLTETREALEQQTATAEVLQVINSSPGALAPVFDAMLERAMRLCGAAFGALYLYDGQHFRAAATLGVAEHVASLMRQPHRPPDFVKPLLEGESLVHIADAAAVAGPEEQINRDTVELGGVRTLLIVPLRKDSALLGTISVFRQEVRRFSEKEIALLQNFAAQAVIAMDNARLLTETREALEQQTATAEILQVINSSPGELAPVFEAILERAHALCETSFGGLMLYDGKRFQPVALQGVPARFREFLEPGIRPESGNPFGHMVEGAPFRQIDDLSEVAEQYPDDPLPRAAVDLGGIRTFLIVALRKDNALLGGITAYRQEVRPFTDKQIALLQNFAAQAVVAIENARLLGELRQRTDDLQESLEYQTAISDVLQVISRSTFDLTPVLQTVVSTAIRLCRADQAVIYRNIDGEYRWAAGESLAPEYERIEREIRIRPGTGTLVGRAASEGKTVQILDCWADPLYEAKADARVGGIHTMLGVPLMRDGTPIGVIGLARRRIEAYTDKEIGLVRTFADQAVIAIHNTRLLTELRESLGQQQAIAEVLQVINRSPGDLQPVFDAILEKAHALCDATRGTLFLSDGETLRATAMHGYAQVPAGRPPARIRIAEDPRLAALLAGERLIHVPDLTQVADPIARAVAERGGVRTNLLLPLRKDGSLLGVISCNRHEVRPFTDKQITLLQNFAAQAVIAMDNARLLDEIRQRQAELRVTFDNMGDGVAMFDAELRLAAWNRNFQQILDLPDEVVEKRPNLADYFRYLAGRGEYPSTDLEVELANRLDDIEREIRFERTRPDGRVVEVRRNPVPGGGFVLIYSDVTERKRAEGEIRAARDTAEKALAELKTTQASLIHAEKMASLGQLTAGIAHEIKNPLNFVNNFAGLSVELLDELKEMVGPGFAMLDTDTRAEIEETMETLTGNLHKITEHGRRADGIVQSMLLHSRGGSGEREMIDLNALVDEALNLAYHGARAQDQNFNITLEREFAAPLAPVELVPQDMTRVFLNLIGNGFHAAHQRCKTANDSGFRPILKVSTRDLGEAVEIRVRDNGIGIAPEHRDKLFQPFFTTKPTGEGTGLGLSISYDIVAQQHGGTITVDSEPGVFTEFTVRLPRR